MLTSTDGGVTWSAPVAIAVSDGVGAFPVVRPDGRSRRDLQLGREANRLVGLARRRRELRGRRCEVAEIQVSSIRELRFFPLPSGRRRSFGPGVGDVARLPLRPRVRREQRARRDVGGRHLVERSGRDHLPQGRVHPGDRHPSTTGRVAVAYRRPSRRDRRRARRVPRRHERFARRAASPPRACKPSGCRTPSRGACSPTTSPCTTPAAGRSWRGCSRRSRWRALSPGRVRDARLAQRVRAPLEPDRVPDGLQLEERLDLPRALRVGRRADDALDVVRGQPLELRESPFAR